MSIVLVTGASGYIGGRLVPELLGRGHRVRCLARTPSKLDDAPWRDQVEVVAGDVTRPDTLVEALHGVDVAYFLVHSMGGRAAFDEEDRLAAATFRDACAQAGVGRIVYLGGLGRDDDPQLSRHLRSRHEVGRVLAAGPVPVTELRAAVIIGSGSASFEMLRYLVEVLPVMVTPRWVDNRCQPIAIRDVLAWLVHALEAPADAAEGSHRVLEIGGPDVLTYRRMMEIYAEEAGLRRRFIRSVPVLTPSLSSRWVGLVTPLPTALARPLEMCIRDRVPSVSSDGLSIPHSGTCQTPGPSTTVSGHPPEGPPRTTMTAPKTLSQKVWDAHVVSRQPGEPDLLFIDLHLVHEVTSPQAFDGLRLNGRTVRRPELTMATEDHNVPTENTHLEIADPISRKQVETLRANCAEFGITIHPMGTPGQGIVHIIGPEQGLTLPGMTVVCGDSHTSTHGAFGALAFGIGTSEVEHVLATRCV